jgi:hypothetical protein
MLVNLFVMVVLVVLLGEMAMRRNGIVRESDCAWILRGRLVSLLSSSLQIARSEALAMLSVTLFCEMFTRQFGCALIKRGDFSMRVVGHAQSRFGRARPINTF